MQSHGLSPLPLPTYGQLGQDVLLRYDFGIEWEL